MRLMFFIRKIILLLMVYLLSSSAVQAVEFDVQAESVQWRYQEYAKAVPSITLPSRADGNGTLAKLRLSSERDQDWFVALSASMMDSSSAAEEKWSTVQTNALSIKQQDVRMDMQYRMLGARFGIWLAQRQQTQQRKNFYINNVYTPKAGEPLSEEINSDWVGLSLTSVGGKAGQFETSIDAALPLKVTVTNPLVQMPYTKKDGYRAAIHFRWTLPKQEVGVSGLNLTLRYEYQELGGENTVANGFWPYNRWQMLALGLMYAW